MDTNVINNDVIINKYCVKYKYYTHGIELYESCNFVEASSEEEAEKKFHEIHFSNEGYKILYIDINKENIKGKDVK